MSTRNSIRHAVRYALLTGAATTAAAPAYAQDENIQEVVVTGSRIAQPNLETTSPITQVTAQDVMAQGVTKIEDLVNQLPQAFVAQNANVANGAAGTATVNLRGLGSPRTLVLIDGRRMPYGGVTNSAADLNQIPTAMIERVEVLTGGASAVYGSDAVAGVVNFIMKKDFEGVQIDGQYSLYQHNNDFGGPGRVKLRDVIAARSLVNPREFRLPADNVTDGNGVQGALTVGVSTEDGRGNITAYVTYDDNKAILQRDRDYSACTLDVNAPTTESFACGGSSTNATGRFTNLLPASNPASYNFTMDSAGAGNSFRPFTGADLYNFGPTNHYLRPQTRYGLGALGHYELAPFADVYTQLMYTDVVSMAQIAPGGAFLDTSTINCDNPLLPQQQLGAIGCTPAMVASGASTTMFVGRRNIEGGGRQQTFNNASFRIVAGSRGEIVEGWSYDLGVQFSRTETSQGTLNFFDKTRLERALDVVRHPDSGAPVCRSVLDETDKACVPYNVFQIGGVTPQALQYLQAPGVQTGAIDQNMVTGVVMGDLGALGAQLPWADESIRVAFGVENRRDKMQNVTDALQTQDLLAGAGGPVKGLAGSTNVNDLFAEVKIPLVQGRPFAEQLALDTAYRYSDYSSGIQTDTYKVGAEWAPVDDVRFRGSVQRAVRAPNIVELFSSQGFGLIDMDGDPCGLALADESQASDAECIASGVPVGALRTEVLDSPAGQYNVNGGGNPGLDPETSTTVSYGAVFTPHFAPGLSVSIDYFDIEIEDLISTFGMENTLTACYEFNDATACSRIHRHPESGALWVGGGFVDDLNRNIGGLETSGVDLNLNYLGLELGSWGNLSVSLNATYLLEIITDPGATGFPPFDCAGLFAGACVSSLANQVNPELRTRTRFTWETPWNVEMALTHRYISSVELEGGNPNRIDRVLDAQHYFDLFASWEATDMAQVRLGINNVLDKDPPLTISVGTIGNGNTFPGTYDALGRYIFGGVTVKF